MTLMYDIACIDCWMSFWVGYALNSQQFCLYTTVGLLHINIILSIFNAEQQQVRRKMIVREGVEFERNGESSNEKENKDKNVVDEKGEKELERENK